MKEDDGGRWGGVGWVGARFPNSEISAATELPRPSNLSKYQGGGGQTLACKGTFQKSFKLPCSFFLLNLPASSVLSPPRPLISFRFITHHWKY